MVTSYKFKLKNGSKKLSVLASKVNFVWNYCNQTSYQAIKNDRKFLSGYDLGYLTAGTAKILNLNSQTIQGICQQYAQSRKQFKKIRLNWRVSKGPRKSLGWIPFKASGIKQKENKITFMGNDFVFFKSQEVEGKIKTGAFVQDSCGDWYVTLTCEQEEKNTQPNNLSVGVDLGQKSIVATSDGQVFENPKYTNRYAEKLAMAQRANKKKLTVKIHRKIKRSRINNLHKISTTLANTYSNIIVGDLKLSKNKQTNDASFRGLIPLLKYKASRLGGKVTLINEAYSTKTCNDCLAETGPVGIKGLAVREWTCESCGQTHDRDINAAKNILRLGHEALKMDSKLLASYPKGILVLKGEEDVKGDTLCLV